MANGELVETERIIINHHRHEILVRLSAKGVDNKYHKNQYNPHKESKAPSLLVVPVPCATAGASIINNNKSDHKADSNSAILIYSSTYSTDTIFKMSEAYHDRLFRAALVS